MVTSSWLEGFFFAFSNLLFLNPEPFGGLRSLNDESLSGLVCSHALCSASFADVFKLPQALEIPPVLVFEGTFCYFCWFSSIFL